MPQPLERLGGGAEGGGVCGVQVVIFVLQIGECFRGSFVPIRIWSPSFTALDVSDLCLADAVILRYSSLRTRVGANRGHILR